MIRIFLALIHLLITLSLMSQEGRVIDEKASVVISTTGLNMRDTPSLDGAIASKLPYGTAVKIIDDGMNLETFSVITSRGDSIEGRWMEVQAGTTKGYVFSAYLKPAYIEFPQKLIDPDYALLIESCVCENAFNYTSDFNWYGIYGDTGRIHFSSKQVIPSYYKSVGPMSDVVCIETNERLKSAFIIGSKFPISASTGYFSGGYSNTSWEDSEGYNQEFYLDNEQLYYCNNNRDVELDSPEDLVARGLVWAGDINEDGIDDFIIHYGSPKYGKLGLLVSGPYSEEKPYRLVAEFTLGYCC